MQHFFDVTLRLLSQATGADCSSAGCPLTQFALTLLFWGALLVFAVLRRGEGHLPHQGLLAWGFSLGLSRELFMLVMAVLPAYGITPPVRLNALYSPLQHALFDGTIVVLGAASMAYLRIAPNLVRRVLTLGLALVGLCFLATSRWWMVYLLGHPGVKFNETWGELLFQTNASLILLIIIAILWRRTRGWARSMVCSALMAIFLYEFLRLPEMAMSHEGILSPIRHGLCLLAIPMFAYLYLHTEEERKERSLQVTMQALEHAYDDLEQRVRERTSELADVNLSLKKEIAARHQVEGVLRQRELWYRNIVEDQTEMICRFTPEGEITFVNEAYCRPYKKRPEEFIGKRFSRYLADEDRARVDECLASLDAICQFKTIEHRVSLPGVGYCGWQQWTIRAIFGADGTISEYQAVGRDVTKEKNIETALRLSEERFRTAFEFAAHGMALVAPDGAWLKANKALCDMVGYSERELLQSDYQSITHPDDLGDNLHHAQRLLTGEIPSYQTRKRYLHKEGHEIWVLLSVSLVKDKVDRPLYFVSQIRDITAQMRAEAELLAIHAELEQRVEVRTAELAAAYEKLHNYAMHQQTIREQERLAVAREIHDELGQCLTGLKMGLSWLGRKVTTDQVEVRERISSLSALADDSIDTVRKISRELRPGMLDDLGLLAALEWLVTEFGNRYAIPCVLAHDIGEFIFNDEVSITLFRICQEALTNISRHAEATRAEVSLTKGDTICMEVRDNGKGITREQAANPQSFGLLGMRERLFPCHGTLEIDGRAGEGTRVLVTIPVVEAALVPRGRDGLAVDTGQWIAAQ